MENRNRLAQAASAYVQAAKDQPVHWYEWGHEAFQTAQREDKPVLLAIGAIWCHWCHVMDAESYSDSQLAALINANFVAVRVDRDEYPAVDARHQAAVATISGQGGWPCTVFLTPEGKPFSGGTYFPAQDRVSRPGFGRVLAGIAHAFHSQREDVEESGEGVMQSLRESENLTEPGPLNAALLEGTLSSALQQFDPRHGGFGAQPKFPQAAALDLLSDTSDKPASAAAQAAHVIRTTLARMAEGGIRDHLAGGFHRYSIDEGWVVPRFEKMAHENSELLRVYIKAYEKFGDPALAQVAGEILGWMDTDLSDREHGGFYASQNADARPGDHGDFFTWTRAEAAAVLTEEEFALVERHYHLRAVGHMQHDPARNVLQISTPLSDLAGQLRIPPEEAGRRLRGAKRKLLAARRAREQPFIDRTLYTGTNGLCISAYLQAARVLQREDTARFALLSLERVLSTAWHPGRGLDHVVAYGEPTHARPAIPATLEEYAYLGVAALDAWNTTGESRWLDAARQLASHLREHFYDTVEGGFFDIASEGEEQLGALKIPRKPIQDAPTPAGNAAAALFLLRLYHQTGERELLDRATRTLEAFAGLVGHLGLYSAGYAKALQLWLTLQP